MKKLTWKEVAELAGLAAILLGICLVYAEIRQSGVIARAELSTVAQQRVEYITAQFGDPEFSKLYIKGLRLPAELDESERHRLHAFFGDVVGIMRYEYHNYQLGIFGEYEGITRVLARRFLMQGFGRASWNVTKTGVHPDIVEFVDEVLANSDNSTDWVRSDFLLREEIESLQ